MTRRVPTEWGWAAKAPKSPRTNRLITAWVFLLVVMSLLVLGVPLWVSWVAKTPPLKAHGAFSVIQGG